MIEPSATALVGWSSELEVTFAAVMIMPEASSDEMGATIDWAL
jgi:hypothetical protein